MKIIEIYGYHNVHYIICVLLRPIKVLIDFNSNINQI